MERAVDAAKSLAYTAETGLDSRLKTVESKIAQSETEQATAKHIRDDQIARNDRWTNQAFAGLAAAVGVITVALTYLGFRKSRQGTTVTVGVEKETS